MIYKFQEFVEFTGVMVPGFKLLKMANVEARRSRAACVDQMATPEWDDNHNEP